MLGGVNIGNVYGAIVGAAGAVVTAIVAWFLNHRTARAAADAETEKLSITHDGTVRSSEAGELWEAYGELSRAQAELLKEVREQLAHSDREVAIATERANDATARADALIDSNSGLLRQLEGMGRIAAELREEREQLSRQVEHLQQANIELREERAALAAQVEQLNGRISHLNALLEEHDIEAGPSTRGATP